MASKNEALPTMRRWRHEKPEYWVFADDMYNWANTTEKRQLVLLFSVLVAGKSALHTADLLNYMMHTLPGFTPFDKIRGMLAHEDPLESLKQFRTGQYRRVLKAFREVVDYDVDAKPDPDALLAIPGIGLKTSRFVALIYDRTLPLAVLDTHVLKFLRHRMGIDVPTSTPTSRKLYDQLSRPIIRIAELLGITYGDLDIVIWRVGKDGHTRFPDELIASDLGLDEKTWVEALCRSIREWKAGLHHDEVSPQHLQCR